MCIARSQLVRFFATRLPHIISISFLSFSLVLEIFLARENVQNVFFFAMSIQNRLPYFNSFSVEREYKLASVVVVEEPSFARTQELPLQAKKSDKKLNSKMCFFDSFCRFSFAWPGKNASVCARVLSIHSP